MNADGKSNPFSPDGKSGAVGNSDAGKSAGMTNQRGPDRPQKSGPPDFNADSVADGGRTLHMDPPSDRGGMIGTTPAGQKHKPFKLGGSTAAPAKNSDVEDGGPVGDIPNEPTADTSE